MGTIHPSGRSNGGRCPAYGRKVTHRGAQPSAGTKIPVVGGAQPTATGMMWVGPTRLACAAGLHTRSSLGENFTL